MKSLDLGAFVNTGRGFVPREVLSFNSSSQAAAAGRDLPQNSTCLEQFTLKSVISLPFLQEGQGSVLLWHRRAGRAHGR